MFCSNCGEKVDTSHKYCSNCGTKITVSEKDKKLDEIVDSICLEKSESIYVYKNKNGKYKLRVDTWRVPSFERSMNSKGYYLYKIFYSKYGAA